MCGFVKKVNTTTEGGNTMTGKSLHCMIGNSSTTNKKENDLKKLLKKLHLTEKNFLDIKVSPLTEQHLWNISLMLEEIQSLQKFNNLSTWFITSNPLYKGLSPYDYILNAHDPEEALDSVDQMVEQQLRMLRPDMGELRTQAKQRKLCKENLERLNAL